jgi:DNA-binding transcriptional MocR family regulator
VSGHSAEEHRVWIDVQLQSALRDWQRDEGPLYVRLSAALRAAIEAGELPAGRKLPPERVLASYLTVGRRTVARAYEALSDRALVDRRQGAGTRVTGPLVRLDDDRAAKRTTSLQRNIVFGSLSHSPDAVIDLLSVYAPGGAAITADRLREAADALQALAATHHGYTPAGFQPLREAIAARYTARGIPTAEDQILITSGAQQATTLIASDLVHSGETAIVEDPTIPGAIDAFRTLGARLLTVPVSSAGVDVDALEAALRRNAIGVVYLMPTFQSPTGTVVPADARRRIAELSAATGVAIVEDTTVAELSLTGEEPPPPIAYYAGDAPVLTIGSLSKLFWAGVRIGWVRGPRELVAHLGRLKAVTDLGSSVIAQVVALGLLEHVDRMREQRRIEMRHKLDRVETLLAGFDGWTWTRPRGGLCLWLRLPYGSALAFTQVARAHGVGVAPGTITSALNHFDDHLRLPFGYDLAVSEEGLRRMAFAWQEYSHLVTPRTA